MRDLTPQLHCVRFSFAAILIDRRDLLYPRKRPRIINYYPARYSNEFVNYYGNGKLAAYVSQNKQARHVGGGGKASFNNYLD